MVDRHAYFFKQGEYVRYNIDTDLVDVGPVSIATFWTHLPAFFQSDLDAVVNWHQTEAWAGIQTDRRILHVMELLVDVYGYPVNGAAGIVGNGQFESGVLPNRLEGSAEATPMRARNFQGQMVDFSADEIMDRNAAAQVGPQLPGIGLAQWTAAQRRTQLFAHPFRGSKWGSSVLFNLEAQVDYLVRELRTGFTGVNAVVSNAAVTVNDASDEFAYNFERPGAVLSGGVLLPRSDPRVQQVFAQRRPLSSHARSVHQNAHP